MSKILTPEIEWTGGFETMRSTDFHNTSYVVNNINKIVNPVTVKIISNGDRSIEFTGITQKEVSIVV